MQIWEGHRKNFHLFRFGWTMSSNILIYMYLLYIFISRFNICFGFAENFCHRLSHDVLPPLMLGTSWMLSTTIDMFGNGVRTSINFLHINFMSFCCQLLLELSPNCVNLIPFSSSTFSNYYYDCAVHILNARRMSLFESPLVPVCCSSEWKWRAFVLRHCAQGRLWRCGSLQKLIRTAKLVWKSKKCLCSPKHHTMVIHSDKTYEPASKRIKFQNSTRDTHIPHVQTEKWTICEFWGDTNPCLFWNLLQCIPYKWEGYTPLLMFAQTSQMRDFHFPL